jgi:hypothetical protein
MGLNACFESARIIPIGDGRYDSLEIKNTLKKSAFSTLKGLGVLGSAKFWTVRSLL